MNERMQKIIELRNKGVSTRNMAKELDISLSNMQVTVNRMIKLGYISKFDPKEVMDKYVAFVELRKSKRPDQQTVIELYQQGLTKKDISEKLNLGERFVRDILKDICKQKSSSFKTNLIEMYEADIPCKEIAKQLNCSEGKVNISIHRLVKQNKLKRRELKRMEPLGYRITKLLETISGVTTTKLLKVGEAAKLLGMSIYKLHQCEAIGLITPTRLFSGQRRYNLDEIKRQLETANVQQ